MPAALRAALSAELTGASVSGRYLSPSGTTITRASPATRNMDSQPKAGISWMPTRAAMDPPIGTPDIIRVAMVDRHLVGTSSATRAFAEGTSPPSPMPARSRRAPKTAALGAKAQRTVKTEKMTAQPRMVRRRPHESAMRPAKIAPIIMPEEGHGTDGSGGGLVQAPAGLGDQRGLDGAVDDEVVAVEDHQQPADKDGGCRALGEPRCGPIGGSGGGRPPAMTVAALQREVCDSCH